MTSCVLNNRINARFMLNIQLIINNADMSVLWRQSGGRAGFIRQSVYHSGLSSHLQLCKPMVLVATCSSFALMSCCKCCAATRNSRDASFVTCTLTICTVMWFTLHFCRSFTTSPLRTTTFIPWNARWRKWQMMSPDGPIPRSAGAITLIDVNR